MNKYNVVSDYYDTTEYHRDQYCDVCNKCLDNKNKFYFISEEYEVLQFQIAMVCSELCANTYILQNI